MVSRFFSLITDDAFGIIGMNAPSLTNLTETCRDLILQFCLRESGKKIKVVLTRVVPITLIEILHPLE